MKTIKLVALAAILLLPVAAGTVTYNTSASTLTCGSAASCAQTNPDEVTIAGTFHVTYEDIASSTVNAPSDISYGYLQETGSGSVSLAGIKLTLDIYSAPPGGSGDLPTGTISGTVTGSSSTALLTFSGLNVVIGQEDYALLESTIVMVPTTSNGGQSSIEGSVSQTPEVSTGFMVLAGVGLIAQRGRRRV
jgi:hypothetical protein